LSDKPLMLSLDNCQLLRMRGSTKMTARTVFEAFSHDLRVVLDQLPGDTTRAVLLVDDVDIAFESGWGQEMADSLRDFLTSPDQSYTLRRDKLALIAAGTRELERIAPRLLTVLDYDVPLRLLSFSEVRRMITQAVPEAGLGREWAEAVYQQTGGHPWLIQYVLKEFCDSCHQDISLLERNFDHIIGDGFQKQEAYIRVFQEWTQQLPEFAAEIIMHLELQRLRQRDQAIQMRGLDVAELSNTVNRSPGEVRQVVERMQELGILYEQPSTPGEQRERYAVGGMFGKWFLNHTGGVVLEREIQRLLQGDQGRSKLNKPFILLMSVSRGILAADGFYTVTDRLAEEFEEKAASLIENVQVVRTEDQVCRVGRQIKWLFADTHKNCFDALRQYLHAAQRDYELEASLVFQVDKRSLLDFPIELALLDDEGFLVNNLPVYKELVGPFQKPVYRLQRNCFSGLDSLNVLLVASGSGGGGFEPLPQTYRELESVCNRLLERGRIGRQPLGYILCLLDDEEQVELPNDQRILGVWPADTEHFEHALQGKLENTEFHVLHYAGHYHFDEEEEVNSGFAFTNGQSVEVFNERQLGTTLQQARLRLAYFSACRSGQHRTSTRSIRFGPGHTCLISGVPVVIGMRWPVRDDEAAILGELFYQHLVKSGRPELALFEVRKETWSMRQSIKEQIGEDSICWAAPVMLTR